MKITEIRYQKRASFKDYEHDELSMNAILDDKECPEEAAAKLKYAVLTTLGVPCEVPAESIAEVVEGGNVKTEAGKTVDPGTNEEVRTGNEIISEAIENTKKTTKKKATKKKASKKPAAKNAPYDRSIEAHRQKFAEVVEKSYPGWRTDAALKVAAKHTSETLNGEDLFSSQGKVLASFNTKMQAEMEAQTNADL